MKLASKATALLVGTIVLTSLLSAAFIYSNQYAMIEKSQKQELSLVAKVVQNSLQSRADNSLSKASLIGSIPLVRESFRSGNRDQLIGLLSETVNAQYDSYGLRSASFFYPPASTFLVLRDLKRPAGEDVSSYRDMLTAAIRRQEPQKGIEISRSGVSLRGVFPVKDDQGLIGVFDYGMDFSDLANDIKRTTGYEIGVFVDNELMSKIALNAPKPESDYIIDGLRNIQATDWKIIKSVANQGMLAQMNDTRFSSTSVNGVEYSALSMPLADFGGRQIGVLVATQATEFQKQTRQVLLNVALFTILQTLIVSGAALILIRGSFVRPLAELGRALKTLEQEKPEAPVILDKAIVNRQDEIGKLAKSIEVIQTRLQADNHPTERTEGGK